MKRYINTTILLTFLTFLYADTVRIMPLGDSITYDNSYADLDNPRPASRRSGYRNYLWYKLQDINYNANFVGSRVAGQSISPKFDADNEGHEGWTSYRIAEHTYDWVRRAKPDIILLHAGSNDWRESPKGIESILDEIDTYEEITGDSVTVILALIINRKKPQRWVRAFNANVKNMAQKRIANGDKIVIVDMEHNAGIKYGGDFQDAVHPNDTGYRKMANLWFKAITNIKIVPKNTKLVPQRFYNFILGRDAEEDGFNSWSNYLENGSVASMAISFFTTEEYLNRDINNYQFIEILYNALLMRVPDRDGLSYWLNEINIGNITRGELIGIFLKSSEFRDVSDRDGLKAITSDDKNILKSIGW